MPETIEYEHFGNAGHLCVANNCRFHLCTRVGKYLVSTVGEYFPDSAVREIFAQSRGVELKGMGDERRYDYMNKIGFEEIGAGRLYETMVFATGAPCTCGCGLPTTTGSELDFNGYNGAGDANRGHAEMCRKWEHAQLKGED